MLRHRWRDLLALVVISVGLLALVVGLATASPPPQDRVDVIASLLRCPVCQSESVADSPSETARQMRALIAEQVAEGRSDDEIVAFFVDRYGEWILLDPPATGTGLALWLAPVVALALGVAWLLQFRRRSATRTAFMVRQAAP